MSTKSVAVIGGGIGGVSAALNLLRAGFESRALRDWRRKSASTFAVRSHQLMSPRSQRQTRECDEEGHRCRLYQLVERLTRIVGCPHQKALNFCHGVQVPPWDSFHTLKSTLAACTARSRSRARRISTTPRRKSCIGDPGQPLDAFVSQSGAVIAHDAVAQLARIQAPTQITFGRHDMVCSTRFADSMKNGIISSELVVFETCAHAPIYENAAEFNEKTLSFLTHHSG